MKKKILFLILAAMLVLTVSQKENRAGEDDLPNPIGKPFAI